jgi:hypothetical protein
MTLSHYRCDWTHPPNEDPVEILYEVDAAGRVPRLIDIYGDGRRECVSIIDFIGAEDELPGAGSLVEGAFHEATRNMLEGHVVAHGEERMSLAPIDAGLFEAEWRRHRRW